MHVSTGSVLCLRSHLRAGFGDATPRSCFGAFQGFSIPAAAGIASQIGGGKAAFLQRTYLQMASVPSHRAGSEEQHEKSTTGGKDTKPKDEGTFSHSPPKAKSHRYFFSLLKQRGERCSKQLSLLQGSTFGV